MLRDETGASILPCWAGGRHEQAVFLLGIFYFEFRGLEGIHCGLLSLWYLSPRKHQVL